MSISAILYLLGMLLIYAGERLLDAYGGLRFGADFLGVVVIGLSIALRVRSLKASTNDGVEHAHRRALLMQAIGTSALFVYMLSADAFVDLAGFSGEFERRWTGVLGAIWPIVWLIGSIPYLALDRAAEGSPVMMPSRRVSQAMNQGLMAALGVALVFPVNFIAARHDVDWNFSYFKTARPGSATKALVESLEEPIDVRIFQPAASEVTPEILSYFRELESPNLRVEVLDQASDPTLAQALRVRDNGYIAFTKGAVDPDEKDLSKRAKTELVNVGTEQRRARRTLKKLDEEVGKALVAMARGKMTAYVTSGHGELSWRRDEPTMRGLKSFKQLLEIWNLDVKALGITEGLGEEVPADADLVIILGPEQDLLEGEREALKRYLERGGNIFVGVEPMPIGRGLAPGEGRENFYKLLETLGVKMGDGVLASTQQIVSVANNKIDRLNVTTDSFSTHPSTVVLADSPSRFFASGAGFLETIENSSAKVTTTVRSSAASWADLNGDLEFEVNDEKKLARTMAVAATGGKGDQTWRAIVVADATAFSDFAIIVKGNQQFLSDGVRWLTRTEAFAGTVENEEDVQIQHTKEGQAGWFYATVMGFPALVLLVGFVRTRRRNHGGEA